MMIRKVSIFCCFLYLIGFGYSLPILKNATREEIKRKDLLPPDHIAGAHMEQDGHINKDYHREVFLGKLVKEGVLVWENMAGYKKLIKVFDEVDKSNDRQIDKEEMKNWIHDRIMEHYNAATEESNKIFGKVDHDQNGLVAWPEYKAQILGLNPKDYEKDNLTVIEDKSGQFEKEIQHWLKADFNGDKVLDKNEFLAFYHPEHNKKTIELMVKEMLSSFDKDNDHIITLEEFTALPPGEVDPEEADEDKLYQEEKAKEFKRDMDLNSDGKVGKEELMQYLDPRNKEHAVKEAEFLIRSSDRNRDGKISEHEMLMSYSIFTGSSLTNFAQVLHDEF
ncbi:45 kDa calcium-binding protein-like [Clytia hemisphaerica]|uniref:EF-hand domain-containing protein n=1 Tax=Clytia hemisphaerica TaxID=252671 RepID=A0A7M5X5B6_9CNID|eukprot:TCONS_00059114-protein